MLTRHARVSLLILMLAVCATASLSQGVAQWKVGDKIETKNNQFEWVPGTVISTYQEDGERLYRVELDDPNAGVRIFYRKSATDLRARPGQETADKPDGNQVVAVNRVALVGGALRLGDLVDTFNDEKLYGPNKGKDRGTIIEAGEGKSKFIISGALPVAGTSGLIAP